MQPVKQSKWEELFSKNPMMAEVTRFRKRFLSIRGSSVAINGGIGIVLVLYALFAIICVYYRGDLEPLSLFVLFIGIMLFAIPLLLHGSISGERERRSWDMLMVAPITHGQIIVGKFMGAFAGLAMAFGLYLIPVIIDAAFHVDSRFINIFLATLVVLAQGASVIAMTLLISARVKRPLIALAVSIAVVMIYFILIPSMIGSIRSIPTQFVNGILSPFDVLSRLARSVSVTPNEFDRYDQPLDAIPMCLTQILYQFFLTICMLIWATKTLVYADNEVKFISKKKRHA